MGGAGLEVGRAARGRHPLLGQGPRASRRPHPHAAARGMAGRRSLGLGRPRWQALRARGHIACP
eukprot:10094994-Lingulodinium_polyedra.AAC.1